MNALFSRLGLLAVLLALFLPATASGQIGLVADGNGNWYHGVGGSLTANNGQTGEKGGGF